MMSFNSLQANVKNYLPGIVILGFLYLAELYSFLLFHSLAEMFSIVIACGIFMIAWNARAFLENDYLVFIGIAFLFISGIDIIHTLAYAGMGVFPEYGANLPTQLWIAARYLQSITLLISPLFLKRKINPTRAIIGYSLITGVIITLIFRGIFPVCYIEGSGLTPFKRISEYVISAFLLVALILLFRNRERLDKNIFWLLILSIVATIISEQAFVFYVGVYDFSNLIGHYFKIFAFYFMYKAIIETGLEKPYNLLFRNLSRAEADLRERESNYRSLFEDSPISLWEEDFSEIHHYLQTLKDSGVSDLRAYFDRHPEAVAYCSSQVRIVNVNQTSIELFKARDAGELTGCLKTILLPESLEVFKEEILAFAAGETHFKGESTYQTLDGMPISCLIALSMPPGCEGNWEKVFVSMVNITERKIAESEQIKLIQELDAFGHTVAHDLKNPLQRIVGLANLLEMHWKQFDDEKLTFYLRTIVEGGTKIGEIISGLLLLSRARQEKVALSTLDMDTIIKGVLKRLSFELEEAGAQIITPDHWPVATGYASWIEEVWVNYIINATKYGGQPLQIELGATVEEGKIRYWVKDQGEGIAPDKQDELFKPFTQLNPADQGHGLGLSIVYRIITRLGGEVGVDSTPGEGSIFYFTLPQAK